MRNSNLSGFSNTNNLPNITGGISQGRIVQFLLEHFNSANLQRQGKVIGNAPDTEIYSNREFWFEMLNNYRVTVQWEWVRLVNFQIVDWFPRTPGLYHTELAEYARIKAGKYVYRDRSGVQFYDPQGKGHMLDGGIGTVRFKPVMIEGSENWLCTATSDGFCHSGIPLAIPSHLMREIEPGFQYTIMGQARFLPDFLESYFQHTRRIPQIYLVVNSIKIVGHSQVPIKITPMAFFTGNLGIGKSISQESQDMTMSGNVTYVTCQANSLIELDKAADWLENYARKYLGEIITNFDEQRPTFQNAPFSLQNVMTGKLEKARLLEFHIDKADFICDTIQSIRTEAITMSKNEINIGDNATVYGDIVAANSIRNSLNKVSLAEVPSELKERLKELTIAIEKMSKSLPKENAQQVARDLETLVAEATSDFPRKEWWQLSVDGLKKAAMNLGEIGKPVLELASLIAAMLTGKPS